MTCVAQTASSEIEASAEREEDPFRAMLREMLAEGFSALRWSWFQSLAPSIREELGADSDAITSMLLKSIIHEAEEKGHWVPGWAEGQMAEARLVQRLHAPRSRYRFVARGEQAGNASLTTKEVRAIRRKYAARYNRLAEAEKTTIKKLSDEYGVVPMTIRRILLRQTWSHIP